jgi:hypothetical protein
MKKLFLKELREQFKVTLIGLAILTVLLLLAFSACNSLAEQTVFSNAYSDASGIQPLLTGNLLTQAAVFCGIFGTLLGWLQIRAERHPDLWAFLVHRPIDRTTILASKVLGGLLLYATGAGVPLFGLVVVASIPGKVAAPFEWAMALPLVAIFLVGIAYYFAGLLTGLRKARWYASQGFGLGLPVLATLALFVVPEFWHALLIIVIAQALLAAAVWGSFRTGGYYRDQPVLGKVALTLASTVSALLIFVGLVAVAMTVSGPRSDHTFSHYQLSKEGQVLRITQHGRGEAEVVDLSGKPFLDEKTGQKIKPKDLYQHFAPAFGAVVDFENSSPQWTRFAAGYSSARRFFHPWRVLNKTLWYLTSDGRLVAYHGVTGRLVDRLAPAGNPGGPDDSHFLRPPDHSAQFFQSYEIPGVLASARTAYLVNLETRELKPLFTVGNGDTIGAAQFSLSRYAKSNLVLVLTRTSIQLLDTEGGTRFQLPYQPSHPAYSSVSVLLLEPVNTYAVRFEPDYFLKWKSGGKLRSHIKWIGADGGIVNSMDLPALPDSRRDPGLEQSLLVLAPPAFPFYSWEEGYRTANILRLVPALLCLAIGWWRGLRYNFTPGARVAWAIFHLLFGLPGLLAFLAVQEWPPREPCSHCTALRVVNHDRCEHCGSTFAPPAKTGLEIFEPLQTN